MVVNIQSTVINNARGLLILVLKTHQGGLCENSFNVGYFIEQSTRGIIFV